jgi:hypothetical protein
MSFGAPSMPPLPPTPAPPPPPPPMGQPQGTKPRRTQAGPFRNATLVGSGVSPGFDAGVSGPGQLGGGGAALGGGR